MASQWQRPAARTMRRRSQMREETGAGKHCGKAWNEAAKRFKKEVQNVTSGRAEEQPFFIISIINWKLKPPPPQRNGCAGLGQVLGQGDRPSCHRPALSETADLREQSSAHRRSPPPHRVKRAWPRRSFREESDSTGSGYTPSLALDRGNGRNSSDKPGALESRGFPRSGREAPWFQWRPWRKTSAGSVGPEQRRAGKDTCGGFARFPRFFKHDFGLRNSLHAQNLKAQPFGTW